MSGEDKLEGVGRRCSHLSHTPKGICLGCGEQHQPLPGYTEQELEQREAEFWDETPPPIAMNKESDRG